MESKAESHYEILGVPEEATQEEISQAYKHLVKHFHPDRNKSKVSTEKTRRLNEAYEILSNPVSRKKYDREQKSGSGPKQQSNKAKKGYKTYHTNDEDFEKDPDKTENRGNDGFNDTERKLYQSLIKLGLSPTPQYAIGWMRVDFAFVDEKIAIEVNGPYHETPEGRARDHQKIIQLKRKGWNRLSYSSDAVWTDPDRVARNIQKNLIELTGSKGAGKNPFKFKNNLVLTDYLIILLIHILVSFNLLYMGFKFYLHWFPHYSISEVFTYYVYYFPSLLLFTLVFVLIEGLYFYIRNNYLKSPSEYLTYWIEFGKIIFIYLILISHEVIVVLHIEQQLDSWLYVYPDLFVTLSIGVGWYTYNHFFRKEVKLY